MEKNCSSTSIMLAKIRVVLFVALMLGCSANVRGDLYIRVWNYTGASLGQWGNGGAMNCAAVLDPTETMIEGTYGPYFGASTTFGPYSVKGSYALYQTCEYGNSTDAVVVAASGYYNGGLGTVTWDWSVFSLGCNSSPAISKVKDAADGAGINQKKDPCGMPAWGVSEPYISLWLRDEPLGYQPAVGPRISFGLAFKQRESDAGYDTNTFSIGKKWNCSWLSYVSQDPTNGGNVVTFAEGGQSTFFGTNDYVSNARLTGDTNSGFVLEYPDGSEDVFGFMVTNSAGAFQRAFMTQRLNPSGQRTVLNYYGYDNAKPVIRLASIVDGDGQVTSIYYSTTNSYSTNLISEVVDPFGRSAELSYDTNGHLTAISDAMGLPSSITYGTNDWPTTLVTPYGPTTFAYTDTSGTNLAPNGRSVLVTEPDGGRQLYLYQDAAPGVVGSLFGTGQIPSTGVLSNSFEPLDLNSRDSFHWGRLQYAALSTTNIASFSSNDFRLARMRHWLRDDTNEVSGTLSMEQSPSPDSAGAINGQREWYDYPGKPNFSMIGTQALPSCVAEVLPDGTSRFTYVERNDFGTVTKSVETWSATARSSVLLRTNLFFYSTNEIDLLAATNALGVLVTSNIYNAYHQVATNYDALGEQTIATFNSNQQISTITRPNGLVSSYNYFTSGASSNLLANEVDYAVVGGSTINFRTNSYTWTNGLALTHTDPRGLTTTNSWDALQRLLQADFPDGTSIKNTYDKLDLVQIIDRMGFTNAFLYNPVRQLIAQTNANGVATLYDYCTCGALTAVTNAYGTPVQAVSTFTYDNQGNRLSSTGADAYVVNYNYDALGRLTNVADAVSSVTNWFNNQGAVCLVSNALGRASSIAVDVLGRTTNTVNANALTITNTFDALNRLLTRGYPDSGVERYGYTLNIAGVTSYTNQLGSNVVNYTFDAMGRKTVEVHPGISTNTFTYDGANDLLTLTDGRFKVTTWIYDIYGLVSNKLDADNNLVFAYKYDADGRLTNRWTPAKGNTGYAYDSVGNLLSVAHPISPSISFGYDALNRMTNMVDGVGTTKYSYNAVGQLLSQEGPWADDTIGYTYSSRDRMRHGLSLQAPNASPWTQSYTYDSAKRLKSLISPAGTFGFGYNGVQQVEVGGVTLPNGAYITNTFDKVGRMLSTTLKNSASSTLNYHGYTYDLIGQPIEQVFTTGNYIDYTYDNIGQLLGAHGKESGGATNRMNEQFDYGYDAGGNLNFRTNNDLVQTFGVNDVNELTTVARNATMTVVGTTTSLATNVTVNTSNAVLYVDSTFARTNVTLSDGNNTFTAIAKDSYGRKNTNAVTVNLPATATYAYDSNGNLLGDGSRSFAYDDENQLTSVWVTNVWRSDFVYDGKMRRRIRREFTWASTWVQIDEVRYVYEGDRVLQERDTNNLPLVSYTGSGGYLLARTDHGLLFSQPGPAHAYYHRDGNGNVTALVDAQQIIVARYLYDPFGKILSLSGRLAGANRYRFSSKEFHENSGLIYCNRRFYDPNLQRWLNRDPIMELGGMNLYGFCANDPLGLTDPTGLGFSWLDWYKDLAQWARRNDCLSKTYLDNNAPVWLATTLETADDFGTGLLVLPSQIAQLGEATGTTGYIGDEPLLRPLANLGTGTGNWSANPTLENSAGVFQDISTFFTVTATGFSALPSANTPVGYGNVVYRYVSDAEVETTGAFIQNVDFRGNPRTTYVTSDAPVSTPAQAESNLQIGAQHPMGPSASPTSIIAGNADGVEFNGPPNLVYRGDGTEMTTSQPIPVISIHSIGYNLWYAPAGAGVGAVNGAANNAGGPD